MKRNNLNSSLASIFFRYVIILLAGLGNLYIFYKIFTPATTHATATILGLFTKTSLSGNLIITSTFIIELIPACIAGSAYYLLFILAMSTPEIKPLKRICIILSTFVTLFVLNIARIIILSTINSSTYFETTHIIFWYLLSTIFVVGIWLATLKVFKIKQIPVYSDIKFLLRLLKHSKNTKRSR